MAEQVVVVETETPAEAQAEAAVAIAKEQTKQTEIAAEAQTEQAEIAAEAFKPDRETIRSVVMECLREHGLNEWKETLDECGRHMMALENGGGAPSSQDPSPESQGGTTPNASSEATPSEPQPVSPSGSEQVAVTVVEAPVPVSTSQVEATTKKRSGIMKLILGNDR